MKEATIVYVSGDAQNLNVASVAHEYVKNNSWTSVYCYAVTTGAWDGRANVCAHGWSVGSGLGGSPKRWRSDLVLQVAYWRSRDGRQSRKSWNGTVGQQPGATGAAAKGLGPRNRPPWRLSRHGSGPVSMVYLRHAVQHDEVLRGQSRRVDDAAALDRESGIGVPVDEQQGDSPFASGTVRALELRPVDLDRGHDRWSTQQPPPTRAMVATAPSECPPAANATRRR